MVGFRAEGGHDARQAPAAEGGGGRGWEGVGGGGRGERAGRAPGGHRRPMTSLKAVDART